MRQRMNNGLWVLSFLMYIKIPYTFIMKPLRFAICSMIILIRSTKVMVFRKSEGQNVGDVCCSHGLNNVNANDGNIRYLASLLRNVCADSAYVSGWNGQRADLVLRQNCSLTPYHHLTNNTCFAICTDQSVVESCFVGNGENSTVPPNQTHRNTICDLKNNQPQSKSPNSLRVAVICPPRYNLQPPIHIKTLTPHEKTPNDHCSPINVPINIPIRVSCREESSQKSGTCRYKPNVTEPVSRSLSGSNIASDSSSGYSYFTLSSKQSQGSPRIRQQITSDAKDSDSLSYSSDSSSSSISEQTRRLVCRPLNNKVSENQNDSSSNNDIDNEIILKAVLKFLHSRCPNNSQKRNEFSCNDVKKALVCVFKALCGNKRRAKQVARIVCGSRKNNYAYGDISQAIAKGRDMLSVERTATRNAKHCHDCNK